MKVETLQQGFNKQRGGYERLVNAGSFRIERAKRTNVLGHGIMASGDGLKDFTAFTVDAARARIAKHATRIAFKQVGDKASVLVVWQVKERV